MRTFSSGTDFRHHQKQELSLDADNTALDLHAPYDLSGHSIPGESGYLISSLLMIFYIMVPFFLSFEKRKPQAREVVLIAVMIALAVASRAAFFMVPQFKPMLAIIIIAGVCLGAQSGF
jgi:energy-coupling factor transport system substrate-specific component